MDNQKTYTLEELEAPDSPALDAESADTYSLDDLDRIDSWSGPAEGITKILENFGKGFASDLARLPGQVGQLIKETGEKGGAGLAIPSFQDGINIMDSLRGSPKTVSSPADDTLIRIGDRLSQKNKEFVSRFKISPTDESGGSRLAFDVGSGASSVLTSLGLLYATRSPMLPALLFGTRQKADVYEEARAAAKTPEEASAISSAAGLIEGGIEQIGGVSFLKSISFNKWITRAIVRAGIEGLEEGAQQAGEEAVTQFSGVRKDRLNDVILRIGYASAIGFFIGVPAGAISTSLEKTGVKNELKSLGFTDEQAVTIMQTVSEKTMQDGSVKAEIEKFIEEEISKTEQILNESLPEDVKKESLEIKQAEQPAAEFTETKKPVTKEELLSQGRTEDQADFILRNLSDAIDMKSPSLEDLKSGKFKFTRNEGEENVKVFRVEIPGRPLMPGDFVFKNKKDALAFRKEAGFKRGQSEIIEKIVKQSDLVSPVEGNFSSQEEFIFFPDETKEETDTEEGETSEPEDGDTSFDFSDEESVNKYQASLSEDDRKAMEFEAEKQFIQDRMKFREAVGKFRKFKKNFLLEEFGEIPKAYITNDPKAMDLDEKAASMGFDSGEELRQAILAFERFRPGAKIKLKEINKFLAEYNRISAKNAKELSKYVSGLEKFLSKKMSSADVKKVVRIKTGQIEAAPKKVTEMQALKASLRAQARAALQSETSTKADLKDLQKGIADTIKAIVPAEGRGKFLTMLADAQTGRDILKVMNRVEKVADEIEKKHLVAAIKKQVKRVKASKNIAVEYVQRIQDLVNNFDLQGRSGKTILSAVETQRFIEEQRQAGKEVSLPEYILNKLSILEKKPLGDIDAATLRNLLSDVQTLAEIGKTKLRARQAFEENRKNKALQEIQAGSKALNSKEILEARVGKELKGEDVRKNRVHQIMNTAQSLDLAITPMDVIFDLLDGNKAYEGANFRIFKKTIDQAFSEYLNKKDSISRDIVKLSEELGLEDKNFERIGFHAARAQEGGLQKLESLGYSESEIDAFELEENEEKLYNAMRRRLEVLRPEIADVMQNVYNEQLGTVKNYFPFMTNFEEMSDFEIRERFGNNIQEFGQSPRKNVEKGFTKSRVGGKQKIKLHAMEIFLRHIDNAAYLITVGQETKWLGEVAKTETYRAAAGDKGQEIVMDWVDTVARKGKMAGERQNALDVLRKNVGMATLGFKLSSTMIQPTALLDGASLVGPQVFEGAKLVATDQAWREFVLENMPEVRARIGDDPSYVDFGSNSIMDKTGRTAFWALQKLDSITASSVAVGAYLKYARENEIDIDLESPDQNAIEFAQLMVRRTQASAFFKDAPQAVTRGKMTGNRQIDRLILQFQTFMLNRWSLIKHDGYALGLKGGNMKQGLNVMTYLILAAIAETGFRGLSKELINLLTFSEGAGDDGFGEQVMGNLIQNIPFVSQVASAVSYGSVPVPAFQFVRTAFDRLEAFSRSKKDSTKAKNAARALTLLSGIFGVPGTVQTDQIIGKIGESGKGSGSSGRSH